jgi:hypothetical protein
MRCPRSGTLAAAALALAACGNYSTDDIAFVEAMPTREALRVAVPAQPAPPPTCPLGLGTAAQWTQARQSGDGMNAGLDWILGVVDLVRSTDPSERHRDSRVWGPFPDGGHPGFRIRVVVLRSIGPGNVPTYSFSFQWSGPGVDWTSLIDGQFIGASGRTGEGNVTLHFDTIRALGLEAKPDDPAVAVTIGYDRRGDPRLVSLALPQGATGFGLLDFNYQYWSWTSGDAHLGYAFQDGRGDRLETQAGWLPAGDGRASVTFRPAADPTRFYQYTVCWDATGCIVAVADFFNVAGYCGTASSCVVPVNWDAVCPQVLQPPP